MDNNDSNRFALIEVDSDDAPASGHQCSPHVCGSDDCTKAPVAPKPAIGFQPPVRLSGADNGAMRTNVSPPQRVLTTNTLAPRAQAVQAAVAAVAVAPSPSVGPTGAGAGMVDYYNTGIDTEARDRATASDAIATAAGLRFKEPTLFAWGTRMIGVGVDAHKRARAELSAQPLMATLAADAAALVAKEARRGDVATLAQLSYAADDRLRTKAGSAGVPMGVQPLKQLLVRAEAPGGGYLADARLPGSLRAPHITHWLDLHRAGEAEALKAVKQENAKRTAEVLRTGAPAASLKLEELPTPKRVKLLSKLDDKGERTLYGVTGPKYPHTYGMDAVIRDVMAGLPGDVRGSLFYDASTTKWRVDAALGTEFTPCVGDLHRVGLKFGSHDAGGGSYWASLYAIRVRCVNFTQISAGKKLGRVKHVGSVEALRDRVKALLDVGSNVLQQYSDLWAEANQTALIADSDAAGGDARAVFRALIEAGHLPAPDGRDQAVENYFNAWVQEPGANRSDYVNAATRAAHEAPWSSPWATDEIEESASQMVYQHVCLNFSQIEAVL